MTGPLTSALAAINALAEAYPALRAADNFQRLPSELAVVEDETQAAGRMSRAFSRSSRPPSARCRGSPGCTDVDRAG